MFETDFLVYEHCHGSDRGIAEDTFGAAKPLVNQSEGFAAMIETHRRIGKAML